MEQRVKWLDVARAIGIFSIFVGHIPNAETGQLAFPFVWTYHVPLFFFISGCAETFSKEKNILRYLFKKAKTILLPWLIFSLLSLGVHVLISGCGTAEVRYYFEIIKAGNIRNQFLAGALWFLTSLFVAQLLFFLIKQLKFRILILVVLLGLHVFTEHFLGPTSPSKRFNYDSALLYLIYYGVGYLCFPYIRRILETKSTIGKAALGLSAVPVFYYALQRFFSVNLLAPLGAIPYVGCLTSVAGTLIMIWFILLFSKVLEDIPFLQGIGTNTLYLCGGEYFATRLLVSTAELLGLSIIVRNSFSAALYALFLLLVANKLIVPIEKWIIGKLEALPAYFCKKTQKEELPPAI